ncbi:hypothetical protein BH11MYX1_BH11MYX1_47690 [soil metagenome]
MTGSTNVGRTASGGTHTTDCVASVATSSDTEPSRLTPVFWLVPITITSTFCSFASSST